MYNVIGYNWIIVASGFFFGVCAYTYVHTCVHTYIYTQYIYICMYIHVHIIPEQTIDKFYFVTIFSLFQSWNKLSRAYWVDDHVNVVRHDLSVLSSFPFFSLPFFLTEFSFTWRPSTVELMLSLPVLCGHAGIFQCSPCIGL